MQVMRLPFLFLCLLILAACDADIDTPEQKAGKEPDPASQLVGTWDAKRLEIDESQASDEEIYAKGVLDYLERTGCVVLSFTFNADGTMETRSKAAYIDANFGPGGLSIPCPEQTDAEAAAYEFEGELLTVTEADGKSLNITTWIEGGVLHMKAADLELEGFSSGGTLVLEKR